MKKIRGEGPLLVMWSGGIDSTLLMYEALRQGREVRAHHVRLANAQGRADLEDAAVDRLAAWFVNNDLRNFRLTRSTTDFGDLRRVLDVKVWTWWVGVILAYEPDIRQVALPTHADAFVSRGAARRQTAVREQLPALSGRADRRFEWVAPLREMSKADILAAMPAALLERCWWCRTPQADEPCHRCRTCRQVDGALSREPDSEPPADPEPTVEPEPSAEPATDPVGIDDFHTGGGWYQLPDGTKVRGRVAALQALEG